jgi:hypothetical protein
VLWTAAETEAVVAAGAAALADAASAVFVDSFLPEVAAALRKGGRLLRWMVNEATPRAVWAEWINVLQGMMTSAQCGSVDCPQAARQLLSEVPSRRGWIWAGLSWWGHGLCRECVQGTSRGALLCLLARVVRVGIRVAFIV